MKPLFRIALSLTLLLAAGICQAAQQPGVPKAGDVLPSFSLTDPLNAAQRAYLGIADNDRFSLDQIPSDIVIVEIFSMYCPICQKEAPKVNRLYQAIEASASAKGRIKVIGIGAGNSAYEVQYFAKSYDVAFPLFADGDYSIHQKLGQVRTPFFIVLKRDAAGSQRVLYAQLGGFDQAAAFLKKIMSLAGMK
jgi:peroxiredoxin